MKTRTLLFVLAAIGFAAAAVFLLRPTPAPPPPVVETARVPLPESQGVDLPTNDFLKKLVRDSTKPAPTAPQAAPPFTVESGMLPWEKQVLAIEQEPTTSSVKAQQLLELLPTVPEEAYAPITAAAVQGLRDSEYLSATLPLLLNVQTHGAIMSELFRDLMERSDAVTLPTLLAIARIPEHPYAASAHDNLNALLGQDLDTDWAGWEQAIGRKLAAENSGTR